LLLFWRLFRPLFEQLFAFFFKNGLGNLPFLAFAGPDFSDPLESTAVDVSTLGARPFHASGPNFFRFFARYTSQDTPLLYPQGKSTFLLCQSKVILKTRSPLWLSFGQCIDCQVQYEPENVPLNLEH